MRVRGSGSGNTHKQNNELRKVEVEDGETVYIITLYLFLDFVKDKIKKLIVSLKHARHCFFYVNFFGAHLVG